MKNLKDLTEFEKINESVNDRERVEANKQFILSDRQEVLKIVRRLIIEAVNETIEEHGSPNVYIDMVGETLIEKIENL